MSNYYLNLFLPAELVPEAVDRCKEFQKVHIYKLEDWKETAGNICESGPSVNLVGLPTGGRVVLVSKKILCLSLKLLEKTEAETVYFALWPKHHEYDVSVRVQPFLHQTFLPGLTTYNCVANDDGFLIEAVAAPDVSEVEILNEVRRKLMAAELTPVELSLRAIIQEGYRSELDSSVFDALVQTSLELNDRGPEFEWYPAVSALGEIGHVLPNTFAMGSGAFPETMCVSWEANQSKETTLCLDDCFWMFIRKFSQTLK